jgi:hypothetical protein
VLKTLQKQLHAKRDAAGFDTNKAVIVGKNKKKKQIKR